MGGKRFAFWEVFSLVALVNQSGMSQSLHKAANSWLGFMDRNVGPDITGISLILIFGCVY